MKILLTMFALSSLLNSVLAGPTNVNGPKTAIIIEKNSLEKGKDCLTFSLKSPGSVLPLGNGKCFTEEELRSLKFDQKAEFAGTVLADAAIAAVTFGLGFVGGATGALLLSATPIAESALGGAIWLLTPATAVGTSVGAVYLSTKLRPLNPFAQYDDIEALNEKIISDIDYALKTDKDVTELAAVLDRVLKNE